MSNESLRMYRNSLTELMTTYWESTRYLTDDECAEMLDAVIEHARALKAGMKERHELANEDDDE